MIVSFRVLPKLQVPQWGYGDLVVTATRTERTDTLPIDSAATLTVEVGAWNDSRGNLSKRGRGRTTNATNFLSDLAARRAMALLGYRPTVPSAPG